MGLTKKEVLWCQHHNWYSIYKRHCIRTEFLACDDAVLDYLKSSQSLQLPIEERGFAEPKPDLFGQVNSDEEWSDWSDDDETSTTVVNPFPAFTSKLAELLKGMSKKGVPKLNWSCPSDATWQMSDNSVMAMTVNEAFLLLKSSDKVNHDLTCPFEYCDDVDEGETEQVAYHIALQRYARLKPISEFRCFIRNSRFIAFCSRNTAFHQNLNQLVNETIRSSIGAFIEDEIIPQCDLDSFVVDLYARADGGFYIFDFSPFSLPTDALYFSWSELKEDAFDGKVSFRCNDGNSIVPLSRNNTLPQDVIHISNGLDVNKFVDYAKLVQEGNLDGETVQL